MLSQHGNWVRGIGSRRERARFRLFCLPYAGGGASAYRELNKHFPDAVEVCPVQLPGREDRLAEPLLTGLPDIVAGLVPAIATNVDLPYAFLGHSMGALIAFEVTRQLRAQRMPLPRHLFVSAHRAPHLPDDDPPLHTLPHDAFVRRLRDYAGTPDLVLRDPELSDIFLPILRADFTICETYAYRPESPVPCPITALGGREDATVTEAELEGWREHTSESFNHHLVDGDHFYLRGAERILAHHICREIVTSA